MLRTFLATRMARIPRMCYIQYLNASGNTHAVRRKEIQRLVRYFANWYEPRIHDRFKELGVDDFVWKEGEISFNRMFNVPNPPVEPHCTITAEVEAGHGKVVLHCHRHAVQRPDVGPARQRLLGGPGGGASPVEVEGAVGIQDGVDRLDAAGHGFEDVERR